MIERKGCRDYLSWVLFWLAGEDWRTGIPREYTVKEVLAQLKAQERAR